MNRDFCEQGEKYRVLSNETKKSRYGVTYLKLQLGNSDRTITAYAWETSYNGPWSFECLQTISMFGRYRTLSGNTVADLACVSPYLPRAEEALHLIPSIMTESPKQIEQLNMIIDSIEHPELQEFVQRTFLDIGFTKAFIQAPASLNYHHAYSGGLLDHSIECVQIVQAVPGLSAEQRDIATCAALFHDAAKAITMTADMNRTRLGQLVDHDALMLEVMYHPLHWLDATWPSAGMALRHIWTCKNSRQWGYSARMAVAHLVQLADRTSAELCKERASFNGVESWRYLGNAVGKERYIRLLHDSGRSRSANHG